MKLTKRTRQLSAIGLFVIASCSIGESDERAQEARNFKADILQTCSDVPRRYVYFNEREVIWEHACRQALQDIEQGDDILHFLTILERLLDDLYDPHISLNTNSDYSPRLVPSGADLWVARSDGRHNIVAVRPGSGAAKAGIRTGDRLVSLNNLTPDELLTTRIHSKPELSSQRRKDWALNAAVAGYRQKSRQIIIEREGTELLFDLGDPEPERIDALVTTQLIENGIAYVRFNNSLGNSDTVNSFDDALDGFSNTKGLILDLRDTPGGGNTGVAEPILGRLISTTKPYQVTVDPKQGSFTRSISPTGSFTYRQPIAVLVGRWTGSMGEGMAIGLDGMQRAAIIGDCMAGLAGGIENIELAQSGISIRIPAYDLTHIDGTARHLWCPEKPQAADTGNDEDELLARAILKVSEMSSR